MPSPLGHALAGLAIHASTAKDAHELRSLRRGAVIVGAAVAPDLDLLLRFVDGRNHHQGMTHSLGFAVIAGLAVAVVAMIARAARPAALGLAAGAAWLSHVLLDLLGRDTHPPIGLMALWPLSHGYFKIPWVLFMDIGRTLEWTTVRHDLMAVGWEVLLLAPVAALSWWLRRPHGH